jgi:hypothetical protein
VRRWVADFRGYRIAVTEQRIDRWLEQFSDDHRDLAARALDAVDFLGPEDIANACRVLLAGLTGWHPDATRREGKWRFVAFSGSAGESGDEMLTLFRRANSLASTAYSELFIHRSDLVREDFGPDDTVVFVDDFSGTGNQAVEYWPQFDELLPGRPNAHLLLVAATKKAVVRIGKETRLTVTSHRTVGDPGNVFLNACKVFTPQDKALLLDYCKRADKRNPKGYGDCGLTLVFAHNCPNNSIPVLHVSTSRWEGLFRRND